MGRVFFPLQMSDFIFISFAPQFACRGVPNSTVLEGAYGSNDVPRWANSGTVLGSVAAMRMLYDELIPIFAEPERQGESDQGK